MVDSPSDASPGPTHGTEETREAETHPSRRAGQAEIDATDATVDASGTTPSGVRELGAPGAVPRGAEIGRYVVLDRLGAGAMGVVFAAYDPELDRRVALKLLQPRGGDRARARARLQREAQALAKLSHPHVVGVHDVGLHEGSVFVAMEYVEGSTLTRWIEREAPGPVEVLGVFRQAGLGLAAAHAAGLTHRDFKPDNVMVDAQGRVRVMDFGLARAEADADDRPADPITLRSDESLGAPLTRTGALLGTPAYMSPEQFAGTPADARSDQFSFAVALWEALYGERPFAGSTLAALALAVGQGDLRSPPRPRANAVPTTVHVALERALRSRAEDRWPDMTRLLEALAFDPLARRRRIAGATAGVAVVGALALAVGAPERTPAPPVPCTGLEAAIDAIWTPESRADIRAALEATGKSFAAASADQVERAIEGWVTTWVGAREDACQATRVRGDQSEALMDLRMACLDRRLHDLRATVGVLSTADEAVATKAVKLADALPRLDRCSDAEALQAEVPPPSDPRVAARVEAMRPRLAEVHTLRRAGKFERATEVLDALAPEAESSGYAPIQAEVAYERGGLQREAGEFDAAVASLEAAYFAAASERMRDMAALASTELIYVLGNKVRDHARARDWGRHARAAAAALGTPGARAHLLHNLSAVENAEGNNEAARALLEEALEIRERELGADHASTSATRNALGNVLWYLGDYEGARAHHEAAREAWEARLGPDHPDLAVVHNSLAVDAYSAAEYDRALEHHARALKIRESVFHPDHPAVAATLHNLGMVYRAKGDTARARATYERVLEIRETTVGPDHPDVAVVLNSLGVLAEGEHDYEASREYHERALKIRRAALPATHPDIASSEFNLALAWSSLGDHEAALEGQRRALAAFEAALGPDHVNVAYALAGMGSVLNRLDRPREAIAPLRRALALRRDKDKELSRHAEVEFHLAQALWDSGGDKNEARELARAAVQHYAAEPYAEKRADVEAWLAAHP